MTTIELATVVLIVSTILSVALPLANAARDSAAADQARMTLVAVDDRIRAARATDPDLDVTDPAGLDELAVRLGDQAAYTVTVGPDQAATGPDTVLLARSSPHGPDALIAVVAAADRCLALAVPPTGRSRWADIALADDTACTPAAVDVETVDGGRRSPTLIDRQDP